MKPIAEFKKLFISSHFDQQLKAYPCSSLQIVDLSLEFFFPFSIFHFFHFQHTAKLFHYSQMGCKQDEVEAFWQVLPNYFLYCLIAFSDPFAKTQEMFFIFGTLVSKRMVFLQLTYGFGKQNLLRAF